MTREELAASLAQIAPPSIAAACQFAERRVRLVERVDELLLLRPDLDALIGVNNRERMLRNHRNHALFMSTLLADYDPERLLNILLWLFPAYHAHGFRLAYWEVELAAWLKVLPELLDEALWREIEPIYRWIAAHLAPLARLGQEHFNQESVFAMATDAPAAADDATIYSLPSADLSDRFMMRIVQATPLALCITDEHGIFEYVNPAYCMFYGYAPAELLGRHFSMVVPPAMRQQLSELHDRFLHEGVEIRGEWTVLDREGQRRTILADAARIVGYDGRPRKVTFVMDITQRKEAERIREDVERLMRHELKTPLNAIINIPVLLRDADNLTDEQRGLLDLLEQSGMTMLKMIDFTLNLYKLESGNYQIQAEQVDLLQVANQARSDALRGITYKNLACDLTYNGGPLTAEAQCVVWGEHLLYYNLLANLIKNALEASPNNATVRVAIVAEADWVKISIHNQGCIPEEIRPRFFTKYATYGKKGGTGLGAYSAKLIAATLGGQIGFVSDEVSGTEITVTLPRDSRSAQTPSNRPASGI